LARKRYFSVADAVFLLYEKDNLGAEKSWNPKEKESEDNKNERDGIKSQPGKK